jgi:signal transduction histidine kinase
MSHELRTPLNAIDGYVDLLELGIRGAVTEPQAIDLRRIKRSANHLLGLINDVLNFAKLEAGRPQLALQTLRVFDVLTDIEPLIAPQLTAKGLTFALESCPADAHVLADREKLDQILINLLTNAYKFTAPGGRVMLGCDVTDGQVGIRVSDTGRGIPAGRLGAIFEPFVQVAPQRGDPPGIGLGLAITRELARALDGDLTVTSVVDVGSTFTVLLPRANAADFR